LISLSSISCLFYSLCGVVGMNIMLGDCIR